MRPGRAILLFILYLFVSNFHQTVFGQVYDLEILDSESGIIGIQINDIAQDQRGYIWIATNSGVSKFDGKTFVNYNRRDGLAENHSVTILCDSKGRVWVGHRSAGISVIYPDSVNIISEASGLINNEVHDIIEDSSGNIWIATFGGISFYDGNKWATKSDKDGLASNNITCLSQMEDGTMWVGTFGFGINVLDENSIRHLHTGNGLVNNYVTDLCVQKKQLFIGTLSGISVWADGSFRTTSLSNGLVSNQVNDISVNRNGDLWLATFNGANRIRDNHLLTISEENGLSSNEVICVLDDREGNTWLGTRKGLVRVKNLAFAHFGSTDEMDIEPTCIFKDSKGTIWAGNETGGVLRYDGYNFVKAFNDPDINDRQISAICEDGYGDMWFGTMDFGGLFQWNRKKLYIYSDEFGLADNNINCLEKDSEGNLLIGTPNGLSVYDGSDFRTVYLSDDMSSSHITALYTATDGTTIVGSADGSTFIIEDGRAESFKDLAIGSPITDICETNDAIVIASQTDGLFLISGENVRQLDEQSGLRGSNIRSAAMLGQNLYVGTSQGLQQLWFIGDSLITRVFDHAHGFLGKSCKRGAMLSTNGSLWVGTSEGITRFQVKERADDLFEPNTFFTQLQLDYRNIDWAARGFELNEYGLPINLELNYTESSLRFFFKGINHRHPKEVTYKWILDGFESNWNPPTDIEYANYPNLSPGTYTLKLIACNSANICTPEPITFTFTITPPIWQTVWFYVILGIMALILTYIYIKIREQRLIEEKLLLEETVQERTKELREQKEIVEGQNKHITESIDYAKNIQMAVLPSEKEMQRAFDDHFVLYRPKDTVGGDFYWVYSKGDVSWAAAVDCTGHGVAGAFMSMIGTDLLNQIIIEKQVNSPGKVLDEMDKGIKLAFAQSAKEFESDQGMDMALIRIDKKKNTLQFAGAHRPLFMLIDGELRIVEGDRYSISCADQRGAENFTDHTMDIEQNMNVYLFSDGIVDQFGGDRGKKFMVRRLREFLDEHNTLPLQEQSVALTKLFDKWKGTANAQVDDVMLLGIRV